MTLWTRAVATGAAAIALSACTSIESIDRVAGMETQGDAFAEGLQAGYVELTRKEIGFYDWVDADAFHGKAAAAAAGDTVLPEDPGDWSIFGEALLAELVAERARLMDALDDGARSDRPEAAARAQTGYDCWVEEAEEGPPNDGPVAAHQSAEMAECRDGYMAAMEEVLYVEPVYAEPAPEEPRPTEFVVYFGWDGSDLSPRAQGFLDDVADEAALQEPSSISIAGHADASGPTDYNDSLSEDRAKAVADYLAARGVSPDAMDVAWFGENDLAVATDDGVREPNNRRVEIVFE